MITSRRSFFRFGLAAATATAVERPLTAFSGSLQLEPSRFPPDRRFTRLNTNENAYGPSAKVVEAVQSAIGNSNRYPRMQYGSLVESIANPNHVKPDQVLLGCGSAEVFRMAAAAFLGRGKKLIQALPTYEAMEHYARAASAEVLSVALTRKFAHDLDAMLARSSATTTLIYICNPNNPTASLTPRKDLEAFIHALPPTTFVLIDEAYHHYAGSTGMYTSFVDQPLDDERVIVTRTFSKVYGLAGLRLGYAVAAPKTIRKMQRFATEDNVNAIVVQAAAAALEDTDGVKSSVRRNADARQEFFNQAQARGLKPIDSHANFMMMNTLHPANDVIEHFRKNDVLIGPSFSSMDTYIRVSLGREEEMLTFWRAWDSLPYPKGHMHH